MDYAATIAHRHEVAAKLHQLHALEGELAGLEPGPGYYDAKLPLQSQIETARRDHQRAAAQLLTLQAGTQTTLL